VIVSDAPNSVKTHFSHEELFTIVIFLIIQTTGQRLFFLFVCFIGFFRQACVQL
jgi:hypothetical protein